MGDFWQFLIVFGQATPSSKPTECSFDDPSTLDHDEACSPGDPANDDQRQTEQEAGGIDPDMALAALDLLGGIVAARPPCMGL